eukprot:2820552-Amphidinium_carterae.2
MLERLQGNVQQTKLPDSKMQPPAPVQPALTSCAACVACDGGLNGVLVEARPDSTAQVEDNLKQIAPAMVWEEMGG